MRTLFHRGLVLVVLPTLLSLGCIGSQQGGGEQAATRPNVGLLKPDFTLTVVEFSREFLKDDKEAGKKYGGKVVEITGEVANVSTPDAGKTAVVQLEGAKKKETDIVGVLVQSPLQPAFTRTGLWLSRKQKVKLTGEYA